MIELKNEKLAVPVVLFAGILWSFGPLVVRYMEDPNLVPWQYIFGRGLTIFIILNLYLYFEEGLNFYKSYYLQKSLKLPYIDAKIAISSLENFILTLLRDS